MKLKTGLQLLLSVSLLAGCASNKPFNEEQLAVVKQHHIVVESLPKNFKEPLPIYKGSDKVGSMVTGVAFGLLTGSYASVGDGNSPRTRLQNNGSTSVLLQTSQRKAMAEEIDTIQPTKVINDQLATYFDRVEKASKQEMAIQIKPVAWHLFYAELFNQQETFYLEYASDITLHLSEESLRRHFTCDKQSEQPLTQEEWFANDALRIRNYVDTLASTCVNQILTELNVPIKSQTIQ